MKPVAALFALLLSIAAAVAAGPAFPLKVGPTGRYLVDQNGAPFLLHGDSAWSLTVALTNVEAEQYLEHRRFHKFNTVLVNLIEHRYGGAANPYGAPFNRDGDPPFLVPGDFTTPNERYFLHADDLLRRAASKGILVLLTPCYLGIPAGDEGWYNEVMAQSEAQMHQYGHYLGNRYKNFPNIIWVIGGDRNPDAAASRVQALIDGIREVDSVHLMTAHCYKENSPRDVFAGQPWLTVSNVYSYNPTWQMALNEYARTPAMPFFLSEARYENGISQPTPTLVRAQGYWANLSGAFGQIVGSEAIWKFDTGWQAALDGTASQNMYQLRRPFAARTWTTLEPDAQHTTLVAGYDADQWYASAARTSDGAMVITYVPSGSPPRTLTYDMSRLAGPNVSAWWFDPQSGNTTTAGSFPTTGRQNFTTPSTSDWVLVLENPCLNPPFGSPLLSVFQPVVAGTTARLQWGPATTATTFDVVSGDLVRLRATGDFGGSTNRCLAQATAAMQLDDPARPAVLGAFFYLVRPRNCAGPGTYDIAQPGQKDSRDPGIAASPAACP